MPHVMRRPRVHFRLKTDLKKDYSIYFLPTAVADIARGLALSLPTRIRGSCLDTVPTLLYSKIKTIPDYDYVLLACDVVQSDRNINDSE
jgi:hypothetical protein